ncbi:GMC oxidoreductase [Pseudomonas batumici]|uniref:Glucose-methanol-choline (GMC) oxidoreductase:NAD binding site n=1 Tax=Pseudomonas batumici TaxID=226910 RepID=A0A0C2I487_9PSED|nr:GMC family oxidoreductase [Pseudomonas batumici]KIH84031.1 Glucose-methanol-choline (GMC) oxidoreductase:NAD binding site [Pseudomonas batumici]
MNTDVLIIGSGVAATALANRLLQADPTRAILILEAGAKVKMQDQALWDDFMVSGSSYSKLPYYKYNDLNYPERDAPGENLNIGATLVPLAGARVMTYGGSTIHWGGWSFRLKAEDFKLKSNTGQGADWPINYAELEPFYNQAECYIGVSGDSKNQDPPRSAPYPFPAFPYTLEDQPVHSAMTALGMSTANVPIARHGITNTTSRHAPCKTTGTCKYCPFGARYAAPNFLNDMTHWGNFPNFRVMDNCVVEEVIMSSKNRTSGVTYLDKMSGQHLTIEANTVIVAGGAIETPKLLLRSCSEYWPNGIGNDHDLVGRYFVTHPYFVFTATVNSNPEWLQPEMDFPTLCSRYFDSPQEQAKGKFILINPPSSFMPLVNGKTLSIAQMMQNGMLRQDIENAVKGSAQVQIHGMVEIPSDYKNRVMNLDIRNRIGLQETIVDYSQSADFNTRMQEIGAHVGRIFEAMGATLSGPPSISWRADHAACTCRMSDNEQEGVIDKNLKLFGVDNLYVCSNAAFPNTGAINPTLTLTALALRLGERLAAPVQP